MMMPISRERVQWLDHRIFLLGRMIQELTLRQSRYLSNPRFASYHTRVMDNLLSEQLQLNIEKNSLVEYIEEQTAKADAAQ